MHRETTLFRQPSHWSHSVQIDTLSSYFTCTIETIVTSEAPLSLIALLPTSFPFDHNSLAALEELADGVLLSSVDPELPLHSHTFSPIGLEVVAGDAIVAGGHGAGIAVRAGRIVVVRIHPMALA